MNPITLETLQNKLDAAEADNVRLQSQLATSRVVYDARIRKLEAQIESLKDALRTVWGHIKINQANPKLIEQVVVKALRGEWS